MQVPLQPLQPTGLAGALTRANLIARLSAAFEGYDFLRAV